MSSPTNWTSRIGFILSAAGSAIGLGAIWKFPYTAGTNGGAVFFLIFLGLTLLVGLPVLLAEFLIGRKSGKNAIDAFKTLAPAGAWAWIGRVGVLACFVLLSFYSVVGGWVLQYVVHAFSGAIHPDADFAALFGESIANPYSAIAYQAVFMLLTIVVVAKGVANGIEKASGYLMPALFIMFILLAVRSLMLPGAMEGVEFLLRPDFSKVTSATFLTALGQAFFALSLGVSAMITYAAYLDKNHNMISSASSVMWLNMLISLLAGLVIFPAVFAFGFEATAGPGLIFIVLPAVFQKMPFGTALFAVFMLLVTFATLTSAFAMLETVIAAAIHQREERRSRITWIAGVAILLLGIPSALSFGVMAEWKIFDKTVFDLWDFLISSLIMPIGALFTAIFVAWVLPKKEVIEHMLSGYDGNPKVVILWYQVLRYLAPIAIILVFIHTLGWL